MRYFFKERGKSVNYRGMPVFDLVSVLEIVTVLKKHFVRPLTGAGAEAHDFPEMIYVLKGEYSPSLDGKAYDLKEGDLLTYAPLVYHKGARVEEADVLIVSFKGKGEALSKIYNRTFSLTYEEKNRLYALVEKGLSSFRPHAPEEKLGGMTLKEGVDPFVLQEIKRELELLIISMASRASLSEERNEQNEERRAVIRYLKEHIGESLTLEEIAKANAMSVSKLKLLFRSGEVGELGGPVNYHLHLKIQEAKRLLREKKYNVSEIAERLGFSSVHYFSRLFKAKVGASPVLYTKTLVSNALSVAKK